MSNLKIKGNDSGTGNVTLQAPNTNTDSTLTLPSSGDVAGTASPTFTGNVGINHTSPNCPVTIKAGNNNYVGGGISIEQAAGTVKSYITHAGDNFYISNGGSVDHLYITPNGSVIKPAQPSFAANYSGSALAVSADSKVTQNRQIFDVGNCYDPSNSRFTAPVAGTYLFNFHTISQNNITNGHLKYVVNGVSPGVSDGMNHHFSSNQGSAWYSISMDHIIRLSTGDYVEVWTGGVGATLHGNSWNRWSGYLVG